MLSLYFDPKLFTFMWIYFLMWTLQSTKNACIHFAQSAKQHLKYKIDLSFYSTWDMKRWSLYAMNFVCITFSTIIDLTTPSTILAAGNFAFFPFDFSCTKSQSLVCNTTLESSMQWIGWYLRDLIFWQVSPNHAPTYLLLPLGKRGSKWGDFHWAMGCV